MDDERLYTLSLPQLETVARMMSQNGQIEQVGDIIVIRTFFIDYLGSMSDGDSKLRNITYEVRRDGKRRMIYRERTWRERGDWVDPTKRDKRREWH